MFSVSSKLSSSKRSICHSSYHDNIYKLNLTLRNPNLQVADVDKILFDKFKRIHDIDFDNSNKTVHLKVHYRSPQDPQKYTKKISYLVHIINLWDCSNMFMRKIESSLYPNYIIDNETWDIQDIPIIIDLDIPYETVDDFEI